MKKYKKELLWTILEIAIFDDFVDDNDLENIFKLTKNFEEKYSRFKVWNYLWNLNKQKKAKIDDDFKTILNIAKKANELSKGHFDITILPFLENIWYWISTEKLEEKVWMENIFIENDEIILKNDVSIEIWWIWKGIYGWCYF